MDYQLSVRGAFLCLFYRMARAVKQEKGNISQKKIWPIDNV